MLFDLKIEDLLIVVIVIVNIRERYRHVSVLRN